MAKRRLENGKRVAIEAVTSADGRKLFIEIYMVRSADGTISFRAICDEIDLDEKGNDVNELTKRALRTAKECSDAVWRPYLSVRFSGVRDPLRPPDERSPANDLFFGLMRYSSSQRVAKSRLEICVAEVELATIGEKKIHRYPPHDGATRAPHVWDGWPKEGREDSREWADNNEHGDMNALIPDTEQNRTALLSIRAAMNKLTMQLDMLLHPERIEAAFARINSTGTIGLTENASSPEEPKRMRGRSPARR